MFYLGIDAGGTNCRVRLVNQNDTIKGDGIAGPANIRRGISTAATAIEAAFKQAMNAAGVDNIPLSDISTAVGIAGFSMTGMIEDLRQQSFLSGMKNVKFVSDAEIANFGAHGGQDGGTVSIGTGAIGIVKQGQNICTLGGYGFPISDLGSGADIGLCAIRNTLRAVDGLIPATDMTNEIFSIFDNDPCKAITFQDTMSATDYAKLTPIVVSHAHKGDPVADQIIQTAAQHATEMIMAIHKLNVPRLSLTGGLGPILMSWLAPEVKALLSEPLGSPLQGAIELAKTYRPERQR